MHLSKVVIPEKKLRGNLELSGEVLDTDQEPFGLARFQVGQNVMAPGQGVSLVFLVNTNVSVELY